MCNANISAYQDANNAKREREYFEDEKLEILQCCVAESMDIFCPGYKPRYLYQMVTQFNCAAMKENRTFQRKISDL